MKHLWLTYLACCLMFLAAAAMADDEGAKLRESKQELDRIKNQLTETRRKADSLQQFESQLQKTISGYSERVSRNRTLINKTERQLRDVHKELQANNDLLTGTEERLAGKRAAYTQLLVDFYRCHRADPGLNFWEFGPVFSQQRMTHYLASISGRTTAEITRVGDSVSLLTGFVDSLEQTGSDLTDLRRQREAKINLDLALKEKEESSLGNIRRQSTLMQERLETLSEAAGRMEQIIAELERVEQQRLAQDGPRPRFRTGSFDQSKGRLQPPIKGKIVSAFGWKKDKITNLSSFSPGIDVKPSRGFTDVVAVAPGRVAYVGSLRGYENFVILEHDDGFYTTYAGLGEIDIDLDELLNIGDKIGTATGDKVHFEIRKGREHLDPVIWLDLNEF